MYRDISFSKVGNTLNRLKLRIKELFPDSGLSKVCMELTVIVNEIETLTSGISRKAWQKITILQQSE